MTALMLRSLAARKARTALTAAAVVLGVGLISGTLILTATINRTFDDVFKEATSGFDVAVQAKQAVKEDFGDPPPISESLLDRVRAVPGVKAAVGDIFAEGIVYDKHGKRLSTQAPNFIASAQPKPFSAFNYVEGRPPSRPDEVALDRKTAQDEGFKLGDSVQVSGDGPRTRLRLVGIAKFGNLESLAGANAAIVTLPEAQRLAGLQGELNEIDVIAKPGVSPVELRDRIARALPANITVRTAQEQADEQAKNIKESFSFINVALLVFAGIALFVGAFIIFNSFSMTIAQRMRELAMLRTLGASRRQILRSVVLEAALVGLVASVLGVLAGLGLAPGLLGLFKVFGLDLPAEGTEVTRQRDRHRPDHRHPGHRRRVPVAGAARDARAAHPRAARGRRAPARPHPPPPHADRLRAHRDRPRRDPLRAVRRRGRRQRGGGPPRRGRRGDLHRRGHAVGQARAAPRLGGRLAAGAPAGRHRAPGARERPAQPRTDRIHRRRPDDRPRAGHLRGDLRGRDQGLGRRRDRRGDPRAVRGPEHRQLQRRARVHGGGSGEACPGSPWPPR